MGIRSELIKIVQKNLFLKNVVLKLFNKLKIGENLLNIDNIHFKNNYIEMLGEKNTFQCAGQSFLQQCKLFAKGAGNEVEVDDKTEIYGNGYQVFQVDGNNNRIIIGKDCVIRNTTFFIKGNNNVIELGDNVSAYGAEFHIEQSDNCLYIGKGTTFHGRNGYPVHIALDEGSRISIEEDCMISNGVQIRSTDSHSIVDLNGKRINHAENIVIGKHCWIGLGCIILKGTNVAAHSVVAAGSVCTSKFTQENCVLAGNPAKIVKQNINWNRKFV